MNWYKWLLFFMSVFCFIIFISVGLGFTNESLSFIGALFGSAACGLIYKDKFDKECALERELL